MYAEVKSVIFEVSIRKDEKVKLGKSGYNKKNVNGECFEIFLKLFHRNFELASRYRYWLRTQDSLKLSELILCDKRVN